MDASFSREHLTYRKLTFDKAGRRRNRNVVLRSYGKTFETLELGHWKNYQTIVNLLRGSTATSIAC